MKERERGDEEIEKYNTHRDGDRNMIHMEIEIEGGNEAWDTEKRKRQNDKEYIDWA